MGSLLETIKYIMNGAKLPNWAKLAFACCAFAVIYIFQQVAVGQVREAQGEALERQTRELRWSIGAIRGDISDLHEDLTEVAMRDSTRARRIERKIERINARVEQINEDGTDGTNARLDIIMREMKRRMR